MEDFTSESSRNRGSTNHQSCFFRLYLPEHNSNTLHISPPFIKNFHGHIPSNITLKNIHGSICRVKLGYIGTKLHIVNGWEQYVKDHSLECGEFVVFRYLKKTTFVVDIYSPDGCLKQEPLGKKSDGIIRGVGKQADVSPTENLRFCKTLNSLKNYISMPKYVADEFDVTIPHRIQLRSDKYNRGISTELRALKDRVIVGFGLGKFWRINNVLDGDRLEFEIICGDDNGVKEIVMRNITQSEGLGRGC